MAPEIHQKTGLERFLAEQSEHERLMERRQMVESAILFGTFAVFIAFLRLAGV